MAGGLWSLGSFSTHITNIVGPSNVPVSLSGATMNNLIWQNIAVVENYLGISISDSAVPEKYQPVVSNLSTAQVLDMIDAINDSVQTVKLDELSITTGRGGAYSPASSLKQLGMDMLLQLQREPRFKKIWTAS